MLGIKRGMMKGLGFRSFTNDLTEATQKRSSLDSEAISDQEDQEMSRLPKGIRNKLKKEAGDLCDPIFFIRFSPIIHYFCQQGTIDPASYYILVDKS